MTGFPNLGANPVARDIERVVNRINGGKFNATGEVTLTDSDTETTLTDPRIGPSSFISFMPLTADALTAFPNLYVSAQENGEATLTHASDASTEQTFRYVVIG